MLEHTEILELHDSAYLAGQTNRERAADDLLFARITQWDDTILGDTLLEYRGQFDQIRKARRQILAEMRSNPVQVSYSAEDGADDDAANVLEGVYRAETGIPTAKQALIIASQDQVDCGFGAWRIVTEYESDSSFDNKQVIRRIPIHEANNTVFFDPNAIMMDKSDARYCCIIHSFNEEGYKNFAEEIGLEDVDFAPPSFRPPEDSYVFPWLVEDKQVHIGEFYYKKRKTEKITIFQSPTGDIRPVEKSKIKDMAEELAQRGFIKVGEKTNKIWVIEKYYVSGAGIIKHDERIAGSNIPVVPVFGEWSRVEGYDVWEGITRLAKDPQRLRNFMLSYLADIASKGARKRPFFHPAQIKGFEFMFEQGGPDNNYPYYLLNRVDDQGNELPQGPISYMETPEIPQAVSGLLEATSGAIDDVTNPGIPQDIASSELSGKAVLALNNRVDMQSFIYIDNLGEALRRDAEIFASIAKEVYDTARDVQMQSEDGQRQSAKVMNEQINLQTGERRMQNDVTKGRFRVVTTVGPAYQSRRAQERDELMQIYTVTEDPQVKNILLMQYLTLLDGSNDVLARHARKQLLMQGLVEPRDEKEQKMLEEMAKKQAEGDPNQKAVQQALHAQAQKDLSEVEKFKAQSIQSVAQAEKYKAEAAEIMMEMKDAPLNRIAKLMELIRGDEGHKQSIQDSQVANAATVHQMQQPSQTQ